MGKPALLQMLTWQNVSIDIDYAPRNVSLEINASLMNLLLESGRIADEKQDQWTDLRKHTRYDCLVGVDYDIGGWTYQCYMYDMSEEGAYIETEQPVRVGQGITISLSSPMIEQSCAAKAKVVRADPEGIGVRFDDLTLQQRQVIRLLLDTRCFPIAGHA